MDASCASTELPSATGLSALQGFFGRGWKEECVLCEGSCGPIRLVRGGAGGAKRSVLKRTSLSEVKALRALAQCRNLVALEESFLCGQGSSEVWVKLEWLRGGDLRTLLAQQGAALLPLETSQFIVSEVLLGLKEMHLRGWMHRDVKEDSVAFTAPLLQGSRDCRVKLLDLKSAVELPSSGRLTEIMGCPECRAPEVFDASYDDLADCWSLGVLAYRLLVGHRPFEEHSPSQLEDAVRNWRQYLCLPPELPELASRFVHGLLVEREARMSSAEAARHPWLFEGLCLGAGQDSGKAGTDGDAPLRRRVSLSNVPSPARNRRPSSPGHASEASFAAGTRNRRPSGRVRMRVEEFERAASRAAEGSFVVSNAAWACSSCPTTPSTSPRHTEMGQDTPLHARYPEGFQNMEVVLHTEGHAWEREAEEPPSQRLALESEREELQLQLAEIRAENEAMDAERAVLRRQLQEAEHSRQASEARQAEERLLLRRQGGAELDAALARAAAAEAERDALRERVARMEEVLERSLQPLQESSSLWKQFAQAMGTQRQEGAGKREDSCIEGALRSIGEGLENRAASGAQGQQAKLGGGEALIEALERERRALEQRIAEVRRARPPGRDTALQDPRAPANASSDSSSLLWMPRQGGLQAEDARDPGAQKREEPPEAAGTWLRHPETSQTAPGSAFATPRRLPAPRSPGLETRGSLHVGAPSAASQPASRPVSRSATPRCSLRSPTPLARAIAPVPVAGECAGGAASFCSPGASAAGFGSPVPQLRGTRWTSPGKAEPAVPELPGPPHRTSQAASAFASPPLTSRHPGGTSTAAMAVRLQPMVPGTPRSSVAPLAVAAVRGPAATVVRWRQPSPRGSLAPGQPPGGSGRPSFAWEG